MYLRVGRGRDARQPCRDREAEPTRNVQPSRSLQGSQRISPGDIAARKLLKSVPCTLLEKNLFFYETSKYLDFLYACL